MLIHLGKTFLHPCACHLIPPKGKHETYVHPSFNPQGQVIAKPCKCLHSLKASLQLFGTHLGQPCQGVSFRQLPKFGTPCAIIIQQVKTLNKSFLGQICSYNLLHGDEIVSLAFGICNKIGGQTNMHINKNMQADQYMSSSRQSCVHYSYVMCRSLRHKLKVHCIRDSKPM